MSGFNSIKTLSNVSNHRFVVWFKIALAFIGLVIILVLVNLNIVSKEDTLQHGEKVLLELAPVDPRSLMQGDYMALSYKIEDDIWSNSRQTQNDNSVYTNNGYVIVNKDENEVAQFKRLTNADSIDNVELKPDEIALLYRVRDGNIKFATNAFFFQEGHAEQYENARYGLFRIDDKGNPLLTNMVDEGFNVIVPK